MHVVPLANLCLHQGEPFFGCYVLEELNQPGRNLRVQNFPPVFGASHDVVIEVIDAGASVNILVFHAFSIAQTTAIIQ